MEYELLDTGIFERRSLLRCICRVRQEHAGGYPDPDQRRAIGGLRLPSIHVLPTLWFRNTWTWWPGAPKPVLKQASGQKGARVVAAATRRIGGPVSVLRGRRPAAVYRERDQQRADFWHVERQPVRQRRHQRLCGGRKAGRGQPGRDGNESRRALSGHCRRRRDSDHPAAA